MSDFQTTAENKPINYGTAFNTYYTYTFINNSQFYALVPAPYVDFYRRFVRQWLYWYDGYVPYFHTQTNGIMSTRLAKSIANKLASQVNGGQMMLDEKEPTDNRSGLKFIEKWADKVNLSNNIDTNIEFAFAGGTSLMKLNYDGKDLWYEPMRMDNFFVDVDWQGNVVDYTGFIHSYTKTVKDKETNHLYYLLEKRYYKRVYVNDQWVLVPYVKYIVKRATQNLTTARSFDIKDLQDVDWNSLPKNIKQSIKKEYGVITIDKEQKMPIQDLGCYLMKATNHISNIPQLQFGESIFSTILSHLMSYDYAFSAFNTNQYLGRSRVMLPKPMQKPADANGPRTENFNEGFDSFLYTKVLGMDPKSQQPVPLQFDLRAKDWQTNRDTILQTMATNLGVNHTTLASYLSTGGEKTAREISVEEGDTALFVQNKREIIKHPINKMLDTVAKFYKKAQNIVVKFSRAGLTNMRNNVEIAQILKATKTVSDKDLLDFVFMDKTPGQLEKMYERNQAQIKEEREFQMMSKGQGESPGPNKSEESQMKDDTALTRTDNDNKTRKKDFE